MLIFKCHWHYPWSSPFAYCMKSLKRSRISRLSPSAITCPIYNNPTKRPSQCINFSVFHLLCVQQQSLTCYHSRDRLSPSTPAYSNYRPAGYFPWLRKSPHWPSCGVTTWPDFSHGVRFPLCLAGEGGRDRGEWERGDGRCCKVSRTLTPRFFHRGVERKLLIILFRCVVSY